MVPTACCLQASDSLRVRPLPSVKPTVHVDAAFLAERLAAVGTLEELLAAVRALVTYEVRLDREELGTVAAGVRALLAV